jgi:hypothetical protein
VKLSVVPPEATAPRSVDLVLMVHKPGLAILHDPVQRIFVKLTQASASWADSNVSISAVKPGDWTLIGNGSWSFLDDVRAHPPRPLRTLAGLSHARILQDRCWFVASSTDLEWVEAAGDWVERMVCFCIGQYPCCNTAHNNTARHAATQYTTAVGRGPRGKTVRSLRRPAAPHQPVSAIR